MLIKERYKDCDKVDDSKKKKKRKETKGKKTGL